MAHAVRCDVLHWTDDEKFNEYFPSLKVKFVNNFVDLHLICFVCPIFSAVSLVFTLAMLFLPRYTHSDTSPTVVFCALTIFMESVLLGSTCSISLPAIVAWLIGGERNLIESKCTQTNAFAFALYNWSENVDSSCLNKLNLNHLFVLSDWFCRRFNILTMRYLVFTVHWAANLHQSHCYTVRWQRHRKWSVNIEISDSHARTTEGVHCFIAHTRPLQMTYSVLGRWIQRWRWNCRRMDGIKS